MFLTQKQQTNNLVQQPEFIPYDVMFYVKLHKASKILMWDTVVLL